ncbi:ATP/GTP-binding protein [Telluribacter sp.]|uniref:ATP/GTP-binding protein n=1 Tax=Telluribacter sp. TaxID=1978767 RepID=UPI002E14633A|nr:ATP/GTP-binding protein [Telluribacter sp.]
MNTKPYIFIASLALLAACSSEKRGESESDVDSSTVAMASLEQIWATDSIVQTPESVLFDGTNNVLYVAQINGKSDEKDGKGGIGKIGTDGQIIDLNWNTGLNAPKGMGMYNGKLYVADLTEVVEIDMSNGKVLRKIPVEGSEFLNDITISGDGTVYVSDSNTKQITMIKDGQANKYFESPTRPNGLLAQSDGLLILDSGNLYKLDASKNLTKLAEGMYKTTDGIEEVAPGEYVVSCWDGEIYFVKEDGTVQKMLDTKDQKINSADIGYDAAKKIVYVPTFFKNSVVAYQLK